jgi:hypothetical protein
MYHWKSNPKDFWLIVIFCVSVDKGENIFIEAYVNINITKENE